MSEQQFCRTIILSLCSIAAALAQSGAQIAGTVHDSSGAIVLNVALTLRNLESGVTRTTQSNAEGVYCFPALVPGRYAIHAKAAGFAALEVTDITLTIGQEITRDLNITPGALNQEITVAAETTDGEFGYGGDLRSGHATADRFAADQLTPVFVAGPLAPWHQPGRAHSSPP